MKKRIILISFIGFFLCAFLFAFIVPLITLGIRSASLNKDYSYLLEDEKYEDAAYTRDIDLVTQHISCGYATIEMLSMFYGERVSEDYLDSINSSVSTSSTKGFLKEVKRSIPDKEFLMKKYLKSDVLLKEIYESLKNNNPVVIEWAALYEGEWTLHFSLISGLDLKEDVVTIYNPYGYIEHISVSEFLSRMSFESYENMPLFLKFGFIYGAFSKNTIFYAQ